mgnify:CR=1 FL=1
MNRNLMSFVLIIILILKEDSFIFGKLNKLLKMEQRNLCKDYVYLHKIENGECGQCKLNRMFAKYAKSFSKLKEGNCYSVGYSIPSGNEFMNVPVIGQIIINKFKKIIG